MPEFARFAELEMSGWADADIVRAYVDRFGPVTGKAATVLAGLAGRPGDKVLDLCCGQGELTRLLTDAGGVVTGLDFSPAMISLAERAAPLADLRRGDAQDLPFDDDSFDTVVCNFGMMHIPDQPKALSEICRVLHPGGRFIMATWVGPEASPAFATVFGAVRKHGDLAAAPLQPDLFAFARPDDAKEMMGGAGLKVARHEIITPAWELSKPDELFEIFMTATVGARMLIKSQSEAVIQAIRRQIEEGVSNAFAVGDGYRVPVPVAVVTAEKP